MATRFRLDEELGDRMTQDELARQADVNVSTVNRMIGNRTAQVSLETLDRVSTVLGCEPGELIERQRKRRR